jgi:hypothetical protein
MTVGAVSGEYLETYDYISTNKYEGFSIEKSLIKCKLPLLTLPESKVPMNRYCGQ